ncbi:MAG: MutT/nudix family protein [Candidatus Roizmanbacteria bacterium GW2011_GWA2_35_8]|uniref:MutT/nudix family protein n=1 Tax=Candidatus Roizmanbacteria bacterium GW2011_GWA2_35_8 TaxID=1618479 RepID=A0A0G0DF45_9BACT|nr:MAG: MutT/nudix family protein [Candidatus Roizmanbacteria bacterium GW2011_GWA2_35_8]
MKTINQTSAGGIVFKLITNHQSLITNRLWLIGQHSQHKGWVFLKGLVGDKDADESKEAAALREVEEEGGIKARIVINEPIVVSYEYVWKNELIKKTVYYYLMEFVSGDTKNHDWEMSDAKFLPENEVKKTLTYPSDKLAFEKALKLI